MDAPKQLDALHKCRERCRWDFLPGGASTGDRQGMERLRLGKDLYKLQDALWAALYNVCSAAMRVKDWE